MNNFNNNKNINETQRKVIRKLEKKYGNTKWWDSENSNEPLLQYIRGEGGGGEKRKDQNTYPLPPKINVWICCSQKNGIVYVDWLPFSIVEYNTMYVTEYL